MKKNTNVSNIPVIHDIPAQNRGQKKMADNKKLPSNISQQYQSSTANKNKATGTK